MKHIETMKRSYSLRPMLAVAALFCVLSAVQAMWAQSPPVPMERLLKNVQAYLGKNPKDAKGYYVLGRLHSLAFATDTREVRVYQDAKNPLPAMPSYESIITPRTATVLTKKSQTHLLASIRNYQKATELDPQHAMAWLGLGWVLEDGAKYADKVEPFSAEKPANSAGSGCGESAICSSVPSA